jgi:CHAD domain-containing protein
MAKLKSDEAGTRGTRRIARRQVKTALEKLGRKTTSDRAVHTARKELKKARATLRLLREALGRSTYKRENAALRDAARPLGAVRDGRVLLDALSSLIEYSGAPAASLPLSRFKRVLSRRRTELLHQILERRGPLRAARKTLRHVRSRSEKWHVGRHGWSVLGQGLKRTYESARQALAQATATRSDEDLHELRKQTKYLWYQLQVLEPLGSGPVAEVAEEACKLGDCLGDDHDLAVLREHVARSRDLFPNAAAQQQLLKLIDRYRAGLQGKALQLGRWLYAQPPAAFIARVGKYWHDWRHAADDQRKKAS